MTKKPRRPTSDELEDQGTDLLLQDTKHRWDEIVRLNQEVAARLDKLSEEMRARNDADYIRRLEATEAHRNQIANNVQTVHVWRDPDKGETWLGVSVVNRREHHSAIDTARELGVHLEAEVINHD